MSIAFALARLSASFPTWRGRAGVADATLAPVNVIETTTAQEKSHRMTAVLPAAETTTHSSREAGS
jgi:hypothetical protein